jgi:hypothetical protein
MRNSRKGIQKYRKGEYMNSFEYIVERIDGDYAHLKRIDIPDADLKLVARAILPPDIMEGVKLKYELYEYTIQ